MEQINDYDCGLINNYGGGDISWWENYIREEINRCNEYWKSQSDFINLTSDEIEKIFQKIEVPAWFKKMGYKKDSNEEYCFIYGLQVFRDTLIKYIKEK